MDAVINFFKEFSSMLPTIKVMDIVDILVVAFLIYKVIMMVRSTSAARIAKSVLIILILAGVTQLLNMYLLNYILDKILEIGLVALIVVFQPELRRMLEKLGSKNVREILSVKEEQREIDRVIEQTVQACEIMAKERRACLSSSSAPSRCWNTRRAAPSWMPASPRSCCATCFSPRRRSMTARSSSAMTALRRRAASCR